MGKRLSDVQVPLGGIHGCVPRFDHMPECPLLTSSPVTLDEISKGFYAQPIKYSTEPASVSSPSVVNRPHAFAS